MGRVSLISGPKVPPGSDLWQSPTPVMLFHYGSTDLIPTTNMRARLLTLGLDPVQRRVSSLLGHGKCKTPGNPRCTSSLSTTVKSKFRAAFHLNRDAAALAKQENIGLPSEARAMKPQGAQHYLWLRFCPRHTFFPRHFQYLDKGGHPLTDMFLALYRRKRAEPLWWVTGSTVDGSKNVIRRKAERRLRRAFEHALRENGFDSAGRRLLQLPPKQVQNAVAGEVKSQTGSAKMASESVENDDLVPRDDDLYGTVLLSVNDSKKFHKVDFAETVKFLSFHVRKLQAVGGSQDRPKHQISSQQHSRRTPQQVYEGPNASKTLKNRV
ncbi:hypothetical protein VTK73DRAFT_2488 [Phialemonium thermophilum]|uniref:Uncharacterized protein n=1 Tax=Phialemonium thermophilum TaxID=223376 RepID=A0ABR3Y2W1_9PEZI